MSGSFKLNQLEQKTLKSQHHVATFVTGMLQWMHTCLVQYRIIKQMVITFKLIQSYFDQIAAITYR